MVHLGQRRDDDLAPGDVLLDGVDALRRYLRFEKADEDDVLSDPGFVRVTAKVSRKLRAAALPAERKAAKEAAQALHVDWAKMPEAERERVLREAQDHLKKAPGKFMPRVDVVLQASTEPFVAGTKRQVVARHKLRISASTNERDERTDNFVRKVESFFVKDNYGQVSDRFSARARNVVADGLRDGLGSADISENLAKALAPLERSRSYWDVVAMSFANRARTFTQVSAFEEAGIDEFRFDAVRDEVTSNICRYMHGRIFHVSTAQKRVTRVLRSEDPEDIKEILPLVKEAVDEDGRRVMYFEQNGRRRAIARIDQSAVGIKDQGGKFSRGMREGALERAGIMFPPLHHRCRSTIIPV